jgi:hypothetical protein
VAAFDRNAWPRSIGLPGRNRRNPQSWLKLDAAVRRIRKDPNRLLYTDQALTEVTEDETELLELFTHSNDARHAVEHERKIARLTGGQSRSLEPDKVL